MSVCGRLFGRGAKCPTSLLIILAFKKDIGGDSGEGRTLPTLATWTNHQRLGGI